jgi:uncharacterized LabA/DUF88 family protein
MPLAYVINLYNAVKTNIYVDGFNLYYGAVKNTPFRWLNVLNLCQILFPKKQINKVKYFSARVKASQHDPSAPTRQDYYWRALRTISNLEIIEGHFVRWPKLMPQYPLAYVNQMPDKPPVNVQVQKTEEKGSDVNLATFLLYDCFSNDYDDAVVISNDSDLALAIEIVTAKLGKSVIIVNPNRTNLVRKDPLLRISKELKRVATACIPSINTPHLVASQFPTILSDSQGQFHKPRNW